MDSCTDCIIQLITVSRKSSKFQELSQFLLSKMQNLAVHVPEIMESKNVEKGEAY